MLVSDIVRRNAGFFPDADAVVVPGRSAVSWAALEERTNQLGRAFLDLGLGKGGYWEDQGYNSFSGS